jgi:hypothetical protein
MRVVAAGLALLALGACSSASMKPPSTFIVFFPADSTALTTDAAMSVDRAAATIKSTHPATVGIGAGVAKGNNLKLAEPRFQTVRQALEARGVPASLLARASLPDTDTKAGSAGDQRVEIILGMEPAKP